MCRQQHVIDNRFVPFLLNCIRGGYNPTGFQQLPAAGFSFVAGAVGLFFVIFRFLVI
jgi:hypothetical protein